MARLIPIAKRSGANTRTGRSIKDSDIGKLGARAPIRQTLQFLLNEKRHRRHAQNGPNTMNTPLTLSTTFSLDDIGRYVCNTLDEAKASQDPGIHPDARPFDLVI